MHHTKCWIKRDTSNDPTKVHHTKCLDMVPQAAVFDRDPEAVFAINEEGANSLESMKETSENGGKEDG